MIYPLYLEAGIDWQDIASVTFETQHEILTVTGVSGNYKIYTLAELDALAGLDSLIGQQIRALDIQIEKILYRAPKMYPRLEAPRKRDSLLLLMEEV